MNVIHSWALDCWFNFWLCWLHFNGVWMQKCLWTLKVQTKAPGHSDIILRAPHYVILHSLCCLRAKPPSFDSCFSVSLVALSGLCKELCISGLSVMGHHLLSPFVGKMSRSRMHIGPRFQAVNFCWFLSLMGKICKINMLCIFHNGQISCTIDFRNFFLHGISGFAKLLLLHK